MRDDAENIGEDGSLPKLAELGVTDYMVIAALLLLSSGIGLYYRCTGGKQATLKVISIYLRCSYSMFALFFYITLLIQNFKQFVCICFNT